ncbi:MAG TPA: hypothetical protein DD614_03740 [Clostridiales bacterium]|nr:hypothetical protein [Clostridiales bacterium]
MKFFLLIILFSLFVIFGIIVYMYYLYKQKLFFDIVYLCKYFKNNISFNKKNINELLNDCYPNISQSSRYFINNRNRLSKLLPKDNKKTINDFFESLGRGDVTFELNNIDYYLNIFEDLSNKSKDEMKSKATVYFKLIIGLGLIVCILLI